MNEVPMQIHGNYNAENIQILEGLEAVRRRPGMYIGSTSERGFHHLVYEILDNGVDEAMAGFCHQIDVTIHADNSVTVRDDGRGIPVDTHPQTGQSALEVVLTKLHAGGKFGGGGYKGAGGLHGVGASVVNALSERFQVDVTREGDEAVWGMQFSKGKITVPFGRTGMADVDAHGTTVTFLPDPTIFSVSEFDYETLKERMREVAFLTKGLTLTLTDERPGKEKNEVFSSDNGLVGYIQFLNQNRTPIYPDIITFSGEKDSTKVEVAFQHTQDYSERVVGYVNNIHTPEGGTHVTGFRAGFTRVLNNFARANNLFKKKDMSLSADDLKEGLSAVISCRVLEPEFEGQTKQKLGNAEVRGVVETIMSEQLTVYLELHPEVGKQICEKAILAQQARDAARQARENTRRKTALENNALPGKLADCSDKNPLHCEIYLVEGRSAGGSAKTARDRKTQAILPLRGKILNVDKASQHHILSNAEIQSMITAFGTGIHDDFDISKLRYDKIVLMTDADVDGAHITTLILTFIYRYMPELIKQGHVFLAKPPLYKLTRNKKDYYAYSDQELASIQAKLGAGRGKDLIQRYKGLGEMDPEQLWETTMDPDRRILRIVDYDEMRAAETDGLFMTLMGESVVPRRRYIEDNAQYADVDA